MGQIIKKKLRTENVAYFWGTKTKLFYDINEYGNSKRELYLMYL